MLAVFAQESTSTGDEYWQQVFDDTSKWADSHLVNILLIIFVAWLVQRYGVDLIMRLIGRTVRTDMYPTEADRKKRIKTLQSIVRAAIRALTWGIALILIVAELNPRYATTLFASAGILSLGIAFGAQSLVKDIVNGVFIIIENQYRVGDFVSLDKVSGTVEAISVRTTTLRDVDGSVHHVPNGTITVTTNKTMDYGRINESLVLAGGTKVETFAELVNKVGQHMEKDPQFEKKLREPPRFDQVTGIDGKGDIIVRITAKTAPSEQAKVRSELLRRLNEAAQKQKISIHT